MVLNVEELLLHEISLSCYFSQTNERSSNNWHLHLYKKGLLVG